MRLRDLEGWEVSFIKAMKLSGRWGNQDIQSAFSTPRRNFCSSRLSERAWPLIGNRPEPAASRDSLELFEAQIAAFGCEQTLQLYRGNRPVFQVDYHFLPVGQGLFAAGQVQVPGAKPFRWIYDCGSHDAQSLIEAALDHCPGAAPQALHLAGPDLWRIGGLLTGDADLAKARGFGGFHQFFSRFGRLLKTGVFQVPHHGSNNSWTTGQASMLNPRLSVFSSGETGFANPVKKAGKKTGHPHPAVWQEFRPFAPARVNQSDSCHAMAMFTPVAV